MDPIPILTECPIGVRHSPYRTRFLSWESTHSESDTPPIGPYSCPGTVPNRSPTLTLSDSIPYPIGRCPLYPIGVSSSYYWNLSSIPLDPVPHPIELDPSPYRTPSRVPVVRGTPSGPCDNGTSGGVERSGRREVWTNARVEEHQQEAPVL